MTDRKPGRPRTGPPPADASAGVADFDGALTRLEEIVQQLDAGTLGLEESLEVFEEGVGLTRRLSAQLDDAERRIEVLSQGAPGSKLTPFEAIGADED